MRLSYNMHMATTSAGTSTKKRIFLIDDEAAMTDLVGRVLSLRGYALSHSNDSVAAVDRALSEDFDAIIVDLMMPRLDGFAIIERLRSSPRHAGTPILVLSARDLTDEERKELLQRHTRFIQKPFSPGRLFEAVRDALAP